MESVPIDGVPGGVCLLDPQSDLVAISVQGTAESGGSLPGVQNPHHRVEAYSLPLAEPATRLWVHDTTQLSYPNGLAVTPLAPHYHRRNLLISDWNHHRVAAIRCTDEGDWREPPLPGFAHDPYEAVVPSDEHHPERRGWRPCDVAILPTREGERSDARFAETAPYAVAVADLESKLATWQTKLDAVGGGDAQKNKKSAQLARVTATLTGKLASLRAVHAARVPLLAATVATAMRQQQ